MHVLGSLMDAGDREAGEIIKGEGRARGWRSVRNEGKGRMCVGKVSRQWVRRA